MLRVVWPSHDAKYAQVWRILDLSGLTSSVRESRNFTKSGFVFLDGHNVLSLRDTVKIGKPFILELRFPNGKIKSKDIMVVHNTLGPDRTSGKFTKHYRG